MRWFRVMTVALAALAFAFTASSKKPHSQPEAEVPAEAADEDAPKPFAEVVKGATMAAGVFPIWTGDKDRFLEIAPARLGQRYLLDVTLASGIGEALLTAGNPFGPWVVSFVRVGQSVQLVASTATFVSAPDSPARHSVESGFATSILASAEIASAAEPVSGAILVSLRDLFLGDLPMLGYRMEQAFGWPYRADADSSSVSATRPSPSGLEVDTSVNYAIDQPPVPPRLSPGETPPPQPPAPVTLPDVRSAVVHLAYRLRAFPDAGYRARAADERVGHFFVQLEDFTNERLNSPTRRLIRRWRVERSDEAAEISPAKQPIVVWLDRAVPPRYRASIRDGILWWNLAFERIGIRDAIVVKQQEDGGSIGEPDGRHAIVRWINAADPGFLGFGPSRADPFTGEIYDGVIVLPELAARFAYRELMESGASGRSRRGPLARPMGAAFSCRHASEVAVEAGFASDLLAVRNFDPAGPEGEAFVDAFMRDLTAHEMGHVLGLTHNFRASTIRSVAELADQAVTIAGSVMDYNPTNLALAGKPQGAYFMSTIGPYDHWAIEYAYKPLSPETEREALAAIAARGASDPQLTFANDLDAEYDEAVDMDPLAARFDLGPDQLAFARHRLALSHELWAAMESRLALPGEGYQRLRRSFDRSLRAIQGSVYPVCRTIGGVYHERRHVGDAEGRAPMAPVPAAMQRAALQVLREGVLSSKSFRFSPALLNKLDVPRFWDVLRPGDEYAPRDYPVHARVLAVQQAVLDRVFHPIVLARIVDSEVRTPEPFRLHELFQGIDNALWEELWIEGPRLGIDGYRRQLQRDHLKRMLGFLLTDTGAPEDARTMARRSLVRIRGRIQALLARRELGMPMIETVETRAHLEESAARIGEALEAKLERTAY